jgi:hypothetical protein
VPLLIHYRRLLPACAEEREKEGTGWIRLKGGEGLASGEEKKEDTPGGKETEEKGKWSSPKDL